jgi:hypothetical protein
MSTSQETDDARLVRGRFEAKLRRSPNAAWKAAQCSY